MVCAKLVGRGLPDYDNISKDITLSSLLLVLRDEFASLIGRFTARHDYAYKLFKILH